MGITQAYDGFRALFLRTGADMSDCPYLQDVSRFGTDDSGLPETTPSLTGVLTTRYCG